MEKADAHVAIHRRIVMLVLRVYRLVISPLFGPSCRFFPSCSNYAEQAVREHGVIKGSALAVARLCKCHPWHPGGYDPVPPSRVDG